VAVDVVTPIVPTPLHVAVITAARLRCQCEGACGSPHKAGGGRCDRGHDRAVSDRLIAAPADPSVPAARAYRVPAEDLRAWCTGCLDRARRLATAPRHQPAQADLPLF
jgi:hypothetical protein